MDTRSPAVESLRRHVLCTLAEQGPLTLAEIPRRWPIVREHIRRAVAELILEGLVERRGTGTGPRPLGLTAAGERTAGLRMHLLPHSEAVPASPAEVNVCAHGNRTRVA